MDNPAPSRLQQLQQLLSGKKIWLVVVGAALFLFIFSIAALVSSQRRPDAKNPAGQILGGGKQGSGSTGGANITPSASDIQYDKQTVLSVVQQVLDSVRSGVLENAADSFVFGLGYWQTEEALIDFLRQDKIDYTQNGTYQGFTTLDNVQVAGDRAQVLVLRTVQGKQRTARYDLQKTVSGWKITTIRYDQKLDLAAVQKLQDEEKKLLENGSYSARPVTFILPAGDTIEINKTFFSSPRNAEGVHEDVEIKVLDAKASYVVLLYNGSRVVDNGYIRTGEPSTYFHSFDIRQLINLQGGSLAFYSEPTKFDFETLGKPADPLFEIPIKLDFSR